MEPRLDRAVPFRHHDDAAIAFVAASMATTPVLPEGRLDDRAAGFQKPARLGVRNHSSGYPILTLPPG
jgi:hypothetical protein